MHCVVLGNFTCLYLVTAMLPLLIVRPVCMCLYVTNIVNLSDVTGLRTIGAVVFVTLHACALIDIPCDVCIESLDRHG